MISKISRSHRRSSIKMLFWKILKYTYFEEHLRTAASEYIFPKTISTMMKNIKYLNLCLLEQEANYSKNNRFLEMSVKGYWRSGCSVKKMFLKILQNSDENTYARVSFLIKLQAEACNFIKRETLTQVFSCEFCNIFKNTFLERTTLVAVSTN